MADVDETGNFLGNSGTEAEDWTSSQQLISGPRDGTETARPLAGTSTAASADHFSGGDSLGRLPPELDRYRVMPPARDANRTAAAPTALGSTSTAGTGSHGNAMKDAAASVGDVDDEDVDEDTLASGLAQVAELDELLARQVECERFARFHRLLHARDNELPLSERESSELEKLQAHVASTDPQFAEVIFKTQAAKLSEAARDNTETEAPESGTSTGRHGPAFGDRHEAKHLLSTSTLASQGSHAKFDDDMTNFVQRNIETVVEAGNVIKLTDTEKARLDALLADCNEEHDASDDDNDEGIVATLTQASSLTSTCTTDSSQPEMSMQIEPREAEVNRIIIRPPLKNAYRLARSQQERLQFIDSHLEHISASSRSLGQAPNSALMHLQDTADSRAQYQLESVSYDSLGSAVSELGGEMTDQVTPRLTADQLQELVVQSRKEQGLVESSALSDARHSVGQAAGPLAVEEYDSGAEDSSNIASPSRDTGHFHSPFPA